MMEAEFTRVIFNDPVRIRAEFHLSDLRCQPTRAPEKRGRLARYFNEQ
jgi:hypothetical protein